MTRHSPQGADLIRHRETARKSIKRPRSVNDESAYTWPFWFAYASNLFITTANAALFRYGDFVLSEGGGEFTLGLIVGIGMIGSLIMRAAQGVGIDFYGVRLIWLVSTVGFVASCLGHLLITDVEGPAVFALRILYQTSIAGIFGSSITFICRQSPVHRMAEVVGTLGTSGFLGMIFGALLVDRLYGAGPITHDGVVRMFVASATLGAISGVFALLATHGHPVPVKRRYVPMLWLLKRYNPGAILVMGITMGFGIGLSGTFLRPFAASLDISGIGTFFSVYATTAFITRLSIRRLPEVAGLRTMILIGVACLALNMASYLAVRSEWEFVWPAIIIGIGHAMLFPAVVAGGSSVFPDRYRGLGTTLMLAMFDLGNLVGAPTVGSLLRGADFVGLPKYPATFITLAVMFSILGIWYAAITRGQPQRTHAKLVAESDAGDTIPVEAAA